MLQPEAYQGTATASGSKTPSANTRQLTHHDVSPGLLGAMAEVSWQGSVMMQSMQEWPAARQPCRCVLLGMQGGLSPPHFTSCYDCCQGMGGGCKPNNGMATSHSRFTVLLLWLLPCRAAAVPCSCSGRMTGCGTLCGYRAWTPSRAQPSKQLSGLQPPLACNACMQPAPVWPASWPWVHPH